MASWQDCLGLMVNLTHTLEELTKVEREKGDAAAQGDLSGVEACMKQEQVLSLKLRGYDQKRDAIFSALDLRGTTLSQLENHCPEELRLETKGVVEELRRQYDLFKATSQVTQDTLEVNLRAIERIQAAQAGDAAQAAEDRKDHQTDFRA